MKNRPRILIVDADPEFTESLEIIFQHETYCISVATNRIQAQKAAQKQKPDAVLLGNIMPLRDAFLLNKWFSDNPQFSDVPVIVIDALQEPQSIILMVEKVLEKAPSKITVSATLDHALVLGSRINQLNNDEELKSKITKEIEEILRRLTTSQDLSKIDKFIAEAKGKLKLEPKEGFWEDKTPCWELTRCPEEIKSRCPAFSYQTAPCWKIDSTYCKFDEHDARGKNTNICQTCRVYRKYSAGVPLEAKLMGRALIDARFSSIEPF